MSRYETDLTDDQWSLISKFVPKPKPGGRPRETNEREVVNAILYFVRGSLPWRHLPKDFPPWQTVYTYFVAMRRSGAVQKIQRALYELTRVQLHERTPAPSAVVIDSQSVKTGKAGGERGYDGGKRIKGRKRHVVVDTLGLMIDVVITPANVHDITGGQKVINRARGWLKAKPKVIFADMGYQGSRFKLWAKFKHSAQVYVSANPAKAAREFVPVKKRWVVERAFAWFGDYRRLDKDQERLMSNSRAMIQWAMIRLMLRRLAPS